MLTLQHSPSLQITPRTRKTMKREQVPARPASAEQVTEMLREIAFVLHASRVVGKKDKDVAAKKE